MSAGRAKYCHPVPPVELTFQSLKHSTEDKIKFLEKSSMFFEWLLNTTN